MPPLHEMTASPAGALGVVAVLASLWGFVQALRRRPGRDDPRAGLGAWAVWWLLLPVAVLLSQAIARAPRPSGGAPTAVRSDAVDRAVSFPTSAATTTPCCPRGAVIQEGTRAAVAGVPEVQRVEVRLVRDPEWRPGVLAPRAWRSVP
jgi:hypothetical protein